MNRAQLLLSAPALALSLAGYAQHTPVTSQYLFNGLLINPAYAGSRDALTANLTYRRQWVGFEGAPVTQVLSVHSPLTSKNIALGLLVYNDRVGVSRETGVFSNYAYRVPFRRGKLSFGLGAGIKLLQANWSAVQTTTPGDAEFAVDSRGVVQPNFSAGTYYYTKRFFVGASLPFILSHTYDASSERWKVENETRHYQPMLTAGTLVKLGADMQLKPSVLLRFAPAAAIQADLNANLIYRDRFWLGVSYRTDDAVVLSLEVLPTQQFRLGYAYDLGLNALSTYHHGSHELMLQYEFGYRVRARDPRYF